MTKYFALSAVLSLAGAPIFAAPVPAAPPVAIEHQVRCSIVFALVAQQQAARVPGADRFAPMAEPGKAFFVSTGLRVIEQQVVTQAALQDYYTARVAKVQADLAAAPQPAAALDREMAQCQPLLAAAPPPAATPTL